ncbi:MAG: sugar phosphate isomerase/epimerase family protein [Ruthenibacterium sp.]
MKLATSTNLMDKVYDTFGVIPPEESVLACKAAGFDVLDYNFCDQGRPGKPITFPDWEEYLARFKSFCDANEILFPQTHLHMYDPAEHHNEDEGWERELLRRSVKGSGILQTSWAVAHPLHFKRAGYTRADYLKLNWEFFGPIVEEAATMGYGLSFENMVQFPGQEYEFACNAADLVELVDGFHLPNVGINWDFGHANLSVPDQAAELRAIGKRIKTTHVADNHGRRDEHLAPFYGFVDWPLMMRTLAEIEYEGDFTYEIQAMSSPLPRVLRATQTAHFVEIARHLIAIFEESKK